MKEKRPRRRTIGFFFLLLSVPLGGSSCIVVPNLAKRLDDERVASHLHVGVSTREDVQKLLGRPISVTEHVWVHEWRTKKGWIAVGPVGLEPTTDGL